MVVKEIAAVGAAFAALIVGIALTDMDLFLSIPKIGWFFWITASGRTMLPFFDWEAFARCATDVDNCPWLASGDVVIDSCAKCGTNWLLTIVHELRTWDQPHLKDFDDILKISPWPELAQFPRDRGLEKWKTFGHEWNNTEFKFKQYKSHLPATEVSSRGAKVVLMPVLERPDVKFLVSVRNPKDTFVSWSHFSLQHRDEFYTQFGGWTMVPTTPWDSITFFEGLGESLSVYSFFNSWYPYRNEPNVLILHYTNMFKNTRKFLRQIAEFLELEGITEEALDVVEERVGVKFMKTHGRRYRHTAGHNHSIAMLEDSGLVRKGGVKTQNDLPKSYDEKVIELGRKQTDSKKLELVLNGFDTIKDMN